jgi:hypothetical protein
MRHIGGAILSKIKQGGDLKKIIILCLFSLALNVVAYCEQVSRIELTDGSVINGEVTSYANGVYTINTTAFGEIRVASAKISKIESLNPPSPMTSIHSTLQTNNFNQSQIDEYGQKLMNDPENAAIITGLATDTVIQELAKDPQIVDAAKAGNIQALLRNEKFMNITNSPKIQGALQKLKQ